ncbi:serine/threonine-protein kinase [Myxococcus sp. MxC21-1]|uniref:serine/threonine protein kinase n=1 Tax=Myxococcus sp. MxC21-1 TaxID=3041439 RepID=UPI00292DD8C2|nr:serine/threonine-protein kinase [Myxococcus sp. MxC21-1]WNZ61745.1 serine/threonine-protein kinase [Myxococcus sp. MxC21-1]
MPTHPTQPSLRPMTEEERAREHPARRPTLFQVAGTRYIHVSTLDARPNGEVLMLAERQERHGLSGPVLIRRVHSPATSRRRHRLVEEVQRAYRLNHPAIAKVLLLTVKSGKPYVIMEYVDGPTLDGVLSLMALRRQPVSTSFALYVGAEVADALAYAHRLADDHGARLGMIHRDVSPRNVSVGMGGEVKLTHFGAAYTHLGGREETQGGLRKGDAAYTSPEYLSCLPLTPAADLFSLGLVLLELATGRHLFHAALERLAEPPPWRQRAPVEDVEEEPSLPLTHLMMWLDAYTPDDVEKATAGLPEGFRAALRKALRKPAAERYTTAEDMRDVLRECLVQVREASGGRPYGRKEAAEELARLITGASQNRDERFFSSGLEAHELGAATPAVTTEP